MQLDFPPVFSDACLVLAGTPIGNIGDATPRLCQAFSQAQIIACEDTRRTRDLLRRLGIAPGGRFVAYHEHNESHLTDSLLDQAAAGQKILMVSDAGMPGVSDPGFRLCHQAAQRGIPFTVLPGPSAPVQALVQSGLPTDSFLFRGFLPRKATALEQSLQSLAQLESTLIFLESPRRVCQSLQAMATVFGAERQAALCRELTKIHQEVIRGTLGEIHAQLSARGEVLGEVVIVVQGCSPDSRGDSAQFSAKMEQLVQKGLRAKEAAKLLSQWFEIPANELYASYLVTKEKQPCEGATREELPPLKQS